MPPGWDGGALIVSRQSTAVRGIRLKGAPGNGVALNAKNCVVEDCLIESCGWSVPLDSAGGELVMCRGSSEGNIVRRCTLRDAKEHCVYEAGAVQRGTVDSCVCSEALGSCLQANGEGVPGRRRGCLGVAFTNNTIYNNTGPGVLFLLSSDGRVEGNTIFANGGYGIHLSAGSTGNTVKGNMVFSASRDAFCVSPGGRLGPSSGNTLAGNTLYVKAGRQAPIEAPDAAWLSSYGNAIRPSPAGPVAQIGGVNWTQAMWAAVDKTSTFGEPADVPPEVAAWLRTGELPVKGGRALAKQVYVSDVIGDGSDENPFRTKLQDILVDRYVNHGEQFLLTTVMPSNPATGLPLNSFALCYVGKKDHAVLRGKQGVDAWPDFPMDAKVTPMQENTKTRWKNSITARGVSIGSLGDTHGYREYLKLVGSVNNPGFDENTFDVGDVAV